MTCQHCAAQLPPFALFCGECGRSVSAPAVAPRVIDRPIAPSTAPAPPIELPDTPDALPWSIDGPLSIDSPLSVDSPLLPSSPAAPRVPDAVDTPPTHSISALAAVEPAHSFDLDACETCGTMPEPDDRFCAECGRPMPGDTRVIVPVVAPVVAAPVVVPEPEPEPAPPVMVVPEPPAPMPAPAMSPDVENTRIVPRGGGGARFVLQFSTGESYTVLGSGLAGRNPHPEPGEFVDHLVTIVDPGRSVSKTHFEFGQHEGMFWVTDRHSGNGSMIREPGAEPRPCEPGRRYPVVRGTRIDIGEQFVVVS